MVDVLPWVWVEWVDSLTCPLISVLMNTTFIFPKLTKRTLGLHEGEGPNDRLSNIWDLTHDLTIIQSRYIASLSTLRFLYRVNAQFHIKVWSDLVISFSTWKLLAFRSYYLDPNECMQYFSLIEGGFKPPLGIPFRCGIMHFLNFFLRSQLHYKQSLSRSEQFSSGINTNWWGH